MEERRPAETERRDKDIGPCGGCETKEEGAADDDQQLLLLLFHRARFFDLPIRSPYPDKFNTFIDEPRLRT